ncbi:MULTISPECIES: LytTR family DNA-binding domain-containing protein [unclassified Pseudoalteromonas]|uniref:LytR/AlgR family response regulator transcription factor n=1 Tax=unclassified Pseudoalteromonas TaxID=194690 RepID=UPI002096AB58|nr:LytTR family DNA-binding domain-containing protein [Pseudoalteromonas sp. XMcav2-N]MCO7186974.1 LytTR family DNA-binding domain-containing protein [Pseudoalteromonas sp. XMcav2-N]
MNYLILDDEPIARRRLRRLMSEFEHFTCVAEASDGELALQLCEDNSPELVFLDIAMPDIDGLEVAGMLRQKMPECKIVFVTAFAEHALRAFDLLAEGYLVKPIDKDRLGALLQHIYGEKMQRLQYQVGHDTRWVAVSDILVARSDERYTHIYFTGGEALVDIPLKKLLATYPRHFVQVHRNTLVKKQAVLSLESVEGNHRVRLDGFAEPITVSRRAAANFKSLF